jgi:hypothetical protein
LILDLELPPEGKDCVAESHPCAGPQFLQHAATPQAELDHGRDEDLHYSLVDLLHLGGQP